MNNTTLIGGTVALLIIAGLLYYITQSTNLLSNTATSTPTGGIVGDSTVDQGPQAGAPSATTNTSVAPTDTTAVVTGTVTPNGDFTSYWYEFGTSASLGNKTSNQNIGSGFAAIPATGYITGLTKNTTYYFKLVAENQYGKVSGSQHSFRTTEGTPPPVGGVPEAKSIAASGISRTSVTLHGEVTPNKAATQYWFEYGKTANLGNTTALTGAGSGSTKVPVSVSLTDLNPSTSYYFRINVQNQFGTVNGAILNFKTDGPAAAVAPSVSTMTATEVAASSARLRGTVNPKGTETKYWFEYSTDSLLGSVLLKTTDQVSVGAGNDQKPVEIVVSALNPKTTYYFRIVARNSVGTVRGDRETFKTK